MATSPFNNEVFNVYTLTFTISGEDVVDPETGNVTSGGTAALSVRAMLKATRDPQLIRLAGADALEVVLSGRYVEPMQKPANLRPGMVAKLTLDGTEGRFTLAATAPSVVKPVPQALGDKIAGVWKAGPV